MKAAAITRFIRGKYQDVSVIEANGDAFFFVGDSSEDQRMPFATLVTSDAHDTASNLTRTRVFRLNIGIARETYDARFGPPPPGPIAAEPIDTGHDYTALDTLMPHPIYAPLCWVCVANPSTATFKSIQPLLAEAHEIAARRRERRDARGP